MSVLEKDARPRYVPTQRRTTFAGLLRSEWIKFTSVRSLTLTTAVAAVLVVGLGVLLSWGVGSQLGSIPEGAPAPDTLSISMAGAQMATLVLAAVGVIVVAGEYSTGMVRTSFAIAPARLPVVAAKAIVLALVVTVVGAVSVLLAFLGGQAILDSYGAGHSLTDDGVVAALAGTVGSLVGCALAGMGLGLILRNTAGAICTVLAAIFVVPLVLMLVPESWGGDTIREYWFSNAMTNAQSLVEQSGYLPAGEGVLVFAVWVLALLGIGSVLVKRRDV
ncbi:ABC transporter permease subunit [Kineococcus gynurae]|uniref:ABC transporter permease subunit n=1 Tax=Kineococcus gynurae TaxID=452979 RepID=A0ABV5LTQ7_9ACTN